MLLYYTDAEADNDKWVDPSNTCIIIVVSFVTHSRLLHVTLLHT